MTRDRTRILIQHVYYTLIYQLVELFNIQDIVIIVVLQEEILGVEIQNFHQRVMVVVGVNVEHFVRMNVVEKCVKEHRLKEILLRVVHHLKKYYREQMKS
jgi:hypothetical protein